MYVPNEVHCRWLTGHCVEKIQKATSWLRVKGRCDWLIMSSVGTGMSSDGTRAALFSSPGRGAYFGFSLASFCRSPRNQNTFRSASSAEVWQSRLGGLIWNSFKFPWKYSNPLELLESNPGRIPLIALALLGACPEKCKLSISSAAPTNRRKNVKTARTGGKGAGSC